MLITRPIRRKQRHIEERDPSLYCKYDVKEAKESIFTKYVSMMETQVN